MVWKKLKKKIGGGSKKDGKDPKPSKQRRRASDSDIGRAAAESAVKEAAARKPRSTSLSLEENGSAPKDQVVIKVRTVGATKSSIKDLPSLRDAPFMEKSSVFVKKLKLCSVIFRFHSDHDKADHKVIQDTPEEKLGKAMKRETLLELNDYIYTPTGQTMLSDERIMSELLKMVSANLCRALPPETIDLNDHDPAEDEPVLEPAWYHLQYVYDFFLRFLNSNVVIEKMAKDYVTTEFIVQLVELFDSEDQRERDCLKMVLHRIYGKFMSHRAFIRKTISNVFYKFVYETERHNGIGELLEIVGSIVNGFATPLKTEHLQFLVRCLVPLHKPKCVELYHHHLSYCVIEYIEKDPFVGKQFLLGFFKIWPWTDSGKQVTLLCELEEILVLLGPDELKQSEGCAMMIFDHLARCLNSDHFQVEERTLFLWKNERLTDTGCLSKSYARQILPLIYRPLYKHLTGHWNPTVKSEAQNVMDMYEGYDGVLYESCKRSYQRREEEADLKRKKLDECWSAVALAASMASPSIAVVS